MAFFINFSLLECFLELFVILELIKQKATDISRNNGETRQNPMVGCISLSKDLAQITESFVWKEIKTSENIDQSFKSKTKEVV